MSQGIIYLIINKQNGHKYVGQTTQPMNKRWQQHIQEALRMSDKPLHCAMRKYGNHNFMIKELDECDKSLLDQREQYWIEQYNTFNSSEGYNATSENLLEIERTDEEVTTLTKKQQSWGFLTDENRGNGKHFGIRIQGLNIETGEIKEWDNARDAAEEVTGNRNKNSNILLSAKKGYKCYGYRWKLLEQKSKKKAVKAVHKITWEEYQFESIADAIRKVSGNNSRGTGLVKSLRSNGRYTWKGFMWFYS
jgi:group I intron endonuclease